jgi:hypothetical protein
MLNARDSIILKSPAAPWNAIAPPALTLAHLASLPPGPSACTVQTVSLVDTSNRKAKVTMLCCMLWYRAHLVTLSP